MALTVSLLIDGRWCTRTTAIGSDILIMFPALRGERRGTAPASPETPLERSLRLAETEARGRHWAKPPRRSWAARKRDADLAEDYATVRARQESEYVADADALTDQARRRRQDIDALARRWGASVESLCQLVNYLRRCEAYWAREVERDLWGPRSVQYRTWQLAYQEAAELATLRLHRAYQREHKPQPERGDRVKVTEHGTYSEQVILAPWCDTCEKFTFCGHDQ